MELTPEQFQGAVRPALRISWYRVLRNRISIAPTVIIHLALVAIPFIDVTIWSVVVAIAVSQIGGLGVTVCYHRYFSHRSFKTSRVMQFILGVMACLVLQKGPLWWAGTHRTHHRYTDAAGDPHSPARNGFWYGYIGWLFTGDHLAVDKNLTKDFAKFPELVWLDRLWMLPGILFATGCYLLVGWDAVVVGYCLTLVIVHQFTHLVNSLCHLFGTQRFQTGDESRNNAILAMLTFGEGCHNNHHHAPYSARMGFRWYELDAGYAYIRLLAFMRLVWDVKVPPKDVMRGEKQADEAAQEPPLAA